jgi:exopolysaccharide biosynthesis protein
MNYESFTQNGMKIQVIKIPKKEITNISFDICTQPKLAPNKMLDTYETKPNVLTNLGFFNTSSGDSIFNVISNGVVYSSDATNIDGWGITTDGEIAYGSATDHAWKHYISSYPTLIADGNKCIIKTASEISGAAHRNIWGWTADTLFNITIEGNGASFSTVQTVILEQFPDCQYALNMDGGGSVAAYVDSIRITDAGWERSVDTVCAVWTKKLKIGYRCQLGFFSKKENAQRYLAVIKSLKSGINGFSYESAFITYDDEKKGYRVQVGFFSVKENAQKVAEDLANLGYDCYIRYVEE